FACAGAGTFWVGWTPLSSWVLLPLVLLAVRRASFPLLTIAFTLLILFGHPETMLHVVVIGGIYAAFEFVPDVGRASARRGRLKRALHSFAIAMGAGLTSLLLTAIFLLPFFAILQHTWQYELFREQAQHPSSVA